MNNIVNFSLANSCHPRYNKMLTVFAFANQSVQLQLSKRWFKEMVQHFNFLRNSFSLQRKPSLWQIWLFSFLQRKVESWCVTHEQWRDQLCHCVMTDARAHAKNMRNMIAVEKFKVHKSKKWFPATALTSKANQLSKVHNESLKNKFNNTTSKRTHFLSTRDKSRFASWDICTPTKCHFCARDVDVGFSYRQCASDQLCGDRTRISTNSVFL